MKFILFTLILIASTFSKAVDAIDIIELTPENVSTHGFFISFEVAQDVTITSMTGPKVINHDCYPEDTGSALLKNDGSEIMVTTTKLERTNITPSLSAYYYAPKTQTMSIWIDYLCAPNTIARKRYVIPSVREYLITSQSMSPTAGQP